MTSIEINNEDEYRLETSTWLAENIDLIEEKQPFSTLHWMPSRERENQHHLDCQKRQKKLYNAGYAGITVPTEYGGHGGEPWMQRIFREEAAGYQVHTGFFN